MVLKLTLHLSEPGRGSHRNCRRIKRNRVRELHSCHRSAKRRVARIATQDRLAGITEAATKFEQFSRARSS